MPNVTRHEVDQMANFMRALNPTEATSSTRDVVTEVRPRIAAQSRPVSVMPRKDRSPMINQFTRTDADDTAAMKTILERLHTVADKAVVMADVGATYDRDLRDAMVTEQTNHGSRIGDWEIQIRTEGNRTFYNVVQNNGAICIAEDLTLYDAAYGLVRILNNGGRVNSRQSLNLLRAEQDYVSALNDAILYRHYMIKKPNDARVAVFEAKYSAAKQRAVLARNTVGSIAKQR